MHKARQILALNRCRPFLSVLAHSMTKPDIEIIAKGLHFPEGPVELPDGSIAVIEIGRGRIVRIREGGKQDLLALPTAVLMGWL